MSESDADPDAPLDAAMSGPLQPVVQQFEAAWKAAVDGGREPDLETYLQEVSESERDSLLTSLEKIDQEYRQRLSDDKPALDDTINYVASETEEPNSRNLGTTILSPPSESSAAGEDSAQSLRQTRTRPGNR